MVKLKFKRRPVKQNIFNLNRGRPLKFVSSGHTSPAFGSFLSIPRPNFNRSLLNRPALSFYGDADKDGVMNGFDCAPFNKRKQGPEHRHNKPMWPFEKAEREEQRKFKKELQQKAVQEDKLKQTEKVKAELNKKIARMEAIRNEAENIKNYPNSKEGKINAKLEANYQKVRKELQAKDEYKYQQGALVMKPESDDLSKMKDQELAKVIRHSRKQDAWGHNAEQHEKERLRDIQLKRPEKESEYDYEEDLDKAEGRAEKISLQRHEDED